jgi:SulP family sulfate permease
LIFYNQPQNTPSRYFKGAIMKLNELFDRRYAKQDIIAGLTLAVESVPDGMAVGALGAVNPINGVYAYMMGGLSGAFFTSSVSMGIQATSAMAVIVATVPEVAVGQPTAKDALLILTVLTGAFMLLFGILRLGSVLRFIPNSVMSAFTHAVGFLIILGQLSNLTGYNAQGANKPLQTIDLLLHLNQVQIYSLITGFVTIIIMVVLQRTRLKNYSILVAMFLGSLVPILFGWEQVTQVQDIAPISGQLPRLFIPDLSTLPSLVTPALALAIVGLVQGAAITHQFPNPDGSKADASGDFIGQGMANIITSFFQGMPVGGSFSATAILVGAGARTRFANIVSGLGIAGVLLLLRDTIGFLAMPSLAGFLLVLGVGVLKPKELVATWKLGGLSRAGMVILILVALFDSLQTAVFVGVFVAVLLYVVRQSNEVTLKQCIYQDGHLILEQDVDPELEANSVVSIQHYGSLFFASAQKYEDQLPHPGPGISKGVVIINLRGQTDLDSSVLDMLTAYAQTLREHDCRLILAGVGDYAWQKLERTGKLAEIGTENVFKVRTHYHESVVLAHTAAETWINQ